jgi:hypothetical protein
LKPTVQRGRLPRLASRLHAVSPSWPHDSSERDSQGQQQQQRSYTSKPAWWQFWVQRSSSDDDSSKGEGELRPPEPLPAASPSAAHQRELLAVNTAVIVNAIIFVAKMCTWAVTGSGCALPAVLAWWCCRYCSVLLVLLLCCMQHAQLGLDDSATYCHCS